ncbi:MAG: 3-deoxy-7-phosphoheptulonate synthase [Candidatus Delongbacteria bacterium]|nr:3-deoxy-7-phosphoheptulonate synthase [Candidatus Delongbacteria bacterium]MBN2836354.1 3-deoxy-7-phosphoheptulonate synthase [Candidatus Delongbacteria bacterium]
MIIVLDKKYSEKSLERIKQVVESSGYNLNITEGNDKIALMVIGSPVNIDKSLFMAIDGVETVIPVSGKTGLTGKTDYDHKSIVTLKNNVMIGRGFTMIAGPCSVETEKQMDEVSYFLNTQGVKILRGGAFKPRTSPYSFQGLEEAGLKLLKKYAEKYNMAIITEAVDEVSLDLVSDYADIIQIGARNMYNYSLLKKSSKKPNPILLKRGMSASTDDLLSSAEYLLAGGNNNVILCERGIRGATGIKDTYVLDFNGVDELQTKTHLPVIIDPSHAAKYKNRVFRLAKAAAAYGSDGMMIELHPDPQSALSDGAQSLNFDMFEKLMKSIAILNGLNDGH